MGGARRKKKTDMAHPLKFCYKSESVVVASSAQSVCGRPTLLFYSVLFYLGLSFLITFV